MPRIYSTECNHCGLQLAIGWGGIPYVLDAVGQRVVCEHPLEMDIIAEVLGDVSEKELKDRTGFMSHCVCRRCAKRLLFDLHRDTPYCHVCETEDVVEVSQTIGQTCPKCGRGTIKSIDTGSIA